MKTAISIPDDVFEAAEQTAERLGLSRSELYARAVGAYLERVRGEGVTEKLDEVYGRSPQSLDGLLVRAQSASIGRERW